MTNHHVSIDDQCSEEQMTFPYLLTLDNETELIGDEPSEETTPEQEPEGYSSESMAAGTMSTTEGSTGMTRTISTPKLTTANPTTTTFDTISATAYTPITADVSTEVAHPINETLNTLRNQLIEARKEIIDLRQIAYQSDIRAREQGLRMLSMENNIRKLMLLHPTTQDSNLSTGNLTPPMTQPSVSTKRTLGENLNNNPPQPLAKRTKTIKVNTTKPRREPGYAGNKPHCPKCNHHHNGPCSTPCDKCHLFGHRTKDCKIPTLGANSNTSKICFECGGTGHIRNECPQLKMKSNDPNNTTGTSYTTTQIPVQYR